MTGGTSLPFGAKRGADGRGVIGPRVFAESGQQAPDHASLPRDRPRGQAAMNSEPSLVLCDLRRNGFRRGARPWRDHPSLGEELDEPARPPGILSGYAAPSPGAGTPADMAGEAVDGRLAEIVQVQARLTRPGGKMPGGIRVAVDRQAGVAQLRQSPFKIDDQWSQKAGVHRPHLRRLRPWNSHVAPSSRCIAHLRGVLFM